MSLKTVGAPDSTQLEPELALGYLIHDVSRLRRKAFDRHIKALKVTRSQWWVLAYISRRDGMAQTQLADHLDVGKVAIGGLIDRLERSGLAKRVPDEADRRMKRIFLTRKGKRLVERLRAASGEFNERMLEGIAPGAIEVAARMLRRLKENVITFIAVGRAEARRDDAIVQASAAGGEPPPASEGEEAAPSPILPPKIDEPPRSP